MKEVYLISCTKKKQNYECCAEEMYMPSTLFQASLNYALSKVENKYDQIFILSAKYHLISLNQLIKPYDLTLKKMKQLEIKQWSKIVYEQMKSKFDINNTHFIFLAGNHYIKPLISYLDKNKYTNPIPLEYRIIGKRIKWLKENSYNNSQTILAKDLRKTELIKTIPKDKPGWYKWWASKEVLEKLLNSKYIEKEYLSCLLPHLTNKNIDGIKYYYIYVGIAVKESIRDRLNWHINQHHTISSVKSGFLSTLRQSISSLAVGNQFDEETTNNLIDLLFVEYFPINLEIKSDEAKEKIENIEKKELSENVIPLNLKDNKNVILKDYLIELKNVRKKSK